MYLELVQYRYIVCYFAISSGNVRNAHKIMIVGLELVQYRYIVCYFAISSGNVRNVHKTMIVGLELYSIDT